jgi:WD40 repeat protein/tRNA A-37 threonylcarbamoyl transferase component Bud32
MDEIDTGRETEGIPRDSFDALLGDLARAESVHELDTQPLPAGERLGRFEIVRLLGRGGFGEVYEARDTQLGRRVAVKRIRPQKLAGGSDARAALAELLRSEAETVARLNHPNVVALYDVGAHQGAPYLVLELVRGESLAERIARGALAAPAALDIAAQVLRGLAHAHAAGVLHRDLKPSNVLVREDGQAKILDFGLAVVFRALESMRIPAPEETPTGGTPAYMAPEQWHGISDERTDLFAVGLMLYEMLTGRSPVRVSASGRSSVRDPEPLPPLPGAPADLARVVSRAVAKAPEERFPTATAFLEALLALQHESEGAASEAPFRYLDAFIEADAAWFFGRDREAARLLQMLSTRGWVIVVGPSGAGKSSLVRAGVWPRFSRGAPHELLVLRPGADPGRSVADLAARLGSEASLAEPGRLGELLRQRARARGERILLFIDQLEEVVTTGASADDRDAFLRTLLAAGDDPAAPVRVVLAVRDDFLGQVARARELRDALGGNLLLLGPPDNESLAESLRGPAQRAGYDFEAGLVEEIVAALRAEAAPLPLLQLAASRLWERRDEGRRLLTRAALSALGGVAGVLAAHANEVLHRLVSADELRVARRMLCDLVTPEGTRRPLEREELLSRFGDRTLAERVLETLVAGRLLTSAKTTAGEWVDLVHESLLERWGELRAWIDSDREERQLRDRLQSAARHWDEHGRPRTLLWADDALEEALRYERGASGALGSVERAFLGAAHALATRARRMRRVLLAVAFAVVVAIALGTTLGMRAYRQAAHEAKVRGILRAAESTPDPALGALLLGELAREPEPEGALNIAHQVLYRPRPTRVLRGHEGAITGIKYTPDGRQIITSAADGTVRIWDRAGGEPRVLRHRSEVHLIALSPDGRKLITGSSGGTARVWRLDADEPPLVLRGHTHSISNAAWFKDGRHVATSSDDTTVRIWDLESGRMVRVLREPGGPIPAFAVSPDGTRAATGTVSGAHLWRLDRDGPEELPIRAPVAQVAFSPDSRLLLTRSSDGFVRLWRVSDRALLRALGGHDGGVASASFTPDGRHAMTSSGDGTLRFWPIEGGEVELLRGSSRIAGLAVACPSGRTVLVGSNDGQVRVWSREGGEPAVLFAGPRSTSAPACAPDEREIATGSSDGSLRLWRNPIDRAVTTLGFAGHSIRAAKISPDGRHIAIALYDTRLTLWPTSGVGAPRVTRLSRGFGFGVRFTPDGRRLVVAHHRQLSIWTVPELQPAGELALPGSLADFVVLRDNRRVAVGDTSGAIHLFAVEGGAPLRSVSMHRGMITDISERADGRGLVTTSLDGTARIWSPDHPETSVVLAHPVPVNGVAWSPNQRELVTTARDGVVRLWRAEGGEPLTLGTDPGEALIVSFSPDGRWVLSTSSDGSARLWPVDRSSGSVALRHEGRIAMNVSDFSPDGKRIITIAGDNTARIWRMNALDWPIDLPTPPSPSSPQIDPFNADGARVLTADSSGIARLWRLFEWSEALRALRAGTRACLTAAERSRYLGESVGEASAAAEQCRRDDAADAGAR